MRLKYSYNSSPSKSSHIPLLSLFLNSWPLFSLVYMNMYICIYICTYMHIYILNSEHSLLSLYNVTYMLAIRADNLILDNQLVWSSVGNTISPTLSIPWLPVVLCVGLSPPGLSQPTSAGLLLSCCSSVHTYAVMLGRILGLASDIHRRHNFTENSFFLWLFQSS